MQPEHGIHTIDTGFNRPRFDAAYLLVEGKRAAFVDCGTNHSVPRLIEALEKSGLGPEAVDWLILTHVHLDHAGGAGELMARLPNARLAVHPRGARHMVDPSKLWAGASAVYGEEIMQRDYGRLRPVPAERVVEAPDGHEIDLAGRTLTCLDTPGHARHHNAIWDPASRSVFTGDTFGLSYREFDTAAGAFIVPTTTPVQFDPDALHASIERLCALGPKALYPTHFGRIDDIPRLERDMHEQIDALVAIALACKDREDRHASICRSMEEYFARRAARHGWNGSREQLHELLGADVELNTQGLEVWLEHRRRDD